MPHRAGSPQPCEAPAIATSLFHAVVSIAPTRRRRFLWAAWWSAPPERDPFRKPDASSGGARSPLDALAAAERAAGRPLLEIDRRWAGAWARILRGEDAWPRRASAGAGHARETGDGGRIAPAAPKGSTPWAFALLGLAKGATAAEIKRAFRAVALRTHPDKGGDDAAFIDAKRAYDVALRAEGKPPRRRRAR
jgi:hypothetical protein